MDESVEIDRQMQSESNFPSLVVAFKLFIYDSTLQFCLAFSY